ncbi:MAG: DEAD/DEAH box helicase [Methylibium sp.]|uniref:DEAD/DEAH box helicase n=1 Tax=Methylibium sp. TaxID=2067992 RepID=UPI0018172791|nr:DEAD/DEAH box helicase [Methylibium sp.]MBA3596104.1 DEAD/DEAH box helicase [Methylibium sp.]
MQSEITPALPASPAEAPPARFDTLALDPKLLRAVADSGYMTMTPIQAKAIPLVLAGRDVMGAAQTGTGKTAAFSLPLLQKMLRHESSSTSPARHPVRALVIAPTRELADQVANSIKTYSKHTQLRATVVFGGIDMKPQTAELKRGVEVVIATPGRLLDHIEAKNCSLNQVEYVVLDEADRMLDIGFLPDLQRILSYLPKTRQTLLFSATFSPEIKKLAQSYLQDPILVETARPNATASTVEQRFYRVEDDDKRAAVRQLLRQRGIGQSLVFVNSKLGAARLARAFERDGLNTSALHGDKSQDERLKALAAFKAGEVDLLVATDVAARGLDIVDLPAVFNFDVPFNAEDYVHRIGRTGRAGQSGLAITLVSRDDARLIADIEKLIKKKLEIEPFEAEDDRPRRPPRRDDGPRDEAPRARSEERAAAPARRYNPPAPPADPFFSQPYEAQASAGQAAPDSASREAASASSGLSRYHKTKKKVAALLGG